MKNRPAYAIESVDNALRLAVLLRDCGPLRVSDAAERLGVARSTAHRLLSMLSYRDFAEQAEDRRYVAGPVLRDAAGHDPASLLRALALPHLRALVERTGETANLVILVGAQVRFLATVQCEQVLRVGDREGRLLPAHLTSGGRMLLAALPEAHLAALYPTPEFDLAALRRLLRRVGRRGFAVNDQETEIGVTAIGRPVRGADGRPVAALSLAVPTARYSRGHLTAWVGSLATAASALERDLESAGQPPREATQPASRSATSSRAPGGSRK
ncbi:MAG: IclR family transcriptional regulator [Pseudonocardia sp.]|nr:IclR family transcriptional regulator [Pseudonocardia sp.]MBO0872723.1 IclR family transcriptional regulator [Pseudonocardia sp.]